MDLETAPFLKIYTLDEAKSLRSSFTGDKTFVFTNGCFDILHPGHLDYLYQASLLGQYLMVGINSDDSVKRLKGPERPIVSQKDRAKMLCGLRPVDGVIIFEEDTPLELIKALRPDVLVKGGDWQVNDIVGGPETLSWGGQVKSLPFSWGYSTTTLIERILSASSLCKTP
ncbi:MAG: D-glycero-beta-D-manno-heptose 1-phosphate adenylyltransferase [Deltaproteobacteria bacterium]|jgi:rfaE bifunctional protein nucleotidyltransferase chain/domain|nr:D-glycero-beta-D-manno-heptose 1-phosphate adenylyltransferase [Deltaproteobacteria bacterium]